MATKLKVLQQLSQGELQAIAEAYDLAVVDWRKLDDLTDAVRVLSKATLADALRHLDRDRLKQICRGLDIDDTGKLKLELAERILGLNSEVDEEQGEEDEKDEDEDESEGSDEGDGEDEDESEVRALEWISRPVIASLARAA